MQFGNGRNSELRGGFAQTHANLLRRIYPLHGARRSGWPSGLGVNASIFALSDGAMRGRAAGDASHTADVLGDATTTASGAGSSSTAANAGAIKPFGLVSAAGQATTAGNALADARLAATLKIGFQPSAEDISATLLDTQYVAPGVTVRQALASLPGVNANTKLIPALV